jgi:hypothetical protein
MDPREGGPPPGAKHWGSPPPGEKSSKKGKKGPSHQPKKPKFFQYMNTFLRIVGRHPGKYPMAMLGSSDPTKEALESMTAQRQVIKAMKHIRFGHGGFIDGDESMILFDALKIVCIVHGDGINPRTALLLALTTRWQVHSVDPIMGGLVCQGDPRATIEGRYGIELPDNLMIHRAKVEDADIRIPDDTDFVIMVGVHSHADLPSMWRRFLGYRRVAFTLPCCPDVNATLDDVDDARVLLHGENEEMKMQSNKCEYFVYTDVVPAPDGAGAGE